MFNYPTESKNANPQNLAVSSECTEVHSNVIVRCEIDPLELNYDGSRTGRPLSQADGAEHLQSLAVVNVDGTMRNLTATPVRGT
jgi:hypothetical protein